VALIRPHAEDKKIIGLFGDAPVFIDRISLTMPRKPINDPISGGSMVSCLQKITNIKPTKITVRM
jgi:hypothetical protein